MDMITYQPQPVGVYIHYVLRNRAQIYANPGCRAQHIDLILESFAGFCEAGIMFATLRRRSCDVFVNESHVRRMFESDKMSVYNSDITIVLHQNMDAVIK